MTQAKHRGPSTGRGKGGGSSFRTTSEQDRAAALACAAHAIDADDLAELLEMLGLTPGNEVRTA